MQTASHLIVIFKLMPHYVIHLAVEYVHNAQLMLTVPTSLMLLADPMKFASFLSAHNVLRTTNVSVLNLASDQLVFMDLDLSANQTVHVVLIFVYPHLPIR